MEDDKKTKENMLDKNDEGVETKAKNGGSIKIHHGPMKIWFYVIIGILVVAIFAVLIILNLPKPAGEDCQTNDGANCGASEVKDDSVQALENTELKSGTVETTVDRKTITYTGAYVVDGIEATIGSGEYESASDNEVVFLVINGGSLKIQGDVTISKTGSEDFAGRGDDYSFYGINSAIVVVGEGSSVSINGAHIKTSVSGANAVVAVNGAEAVVMNSDIETSKDGSRGLHATYGGSINADKVSIKTEGASSASLATDRGSGTVVVDNATLSTAGAGSPLIYSTGKITASNSTGTSTGAQIAVVEGKNSITLDGCNFSANGKGNRGSVDNAGVMIYQSMSGDASVGVGSFTATDSKLAVLSTDYYDDVPFFFITNTEATVDLTDVEISFSSAAKFISAAGTSEWGRSGSNGGRVTVNLTDITATNTEVSVDTISSIEGI